LLYIEVDFLCKELGTAQMSDNFYEDEFRVYIDSRGVEMPFMSYEYALRTMIDLANKNNFDENDTVSGDDLIIAQKVWQDEAIKTLIRSMPEIFSLKLEQSNSAREDSGGLTHADRGMTPDHPLEALKICLGIAEEGVVDPSEAIGV
jgi:hypothetical protein